MLDDAVENDDEEMIEVAKLSRDLKQAARLLSRAEARFFVAAYYKMQKDRIRAEQQASELEKQGLPGQLMTWLSGQRLVLEKNVAGALDNYSSSQPVGAWARSLKGVGPIISAGMLAHIDIEKCPTVGHLWRFAGLDPTTRKQSGQKQPWNSKLKRLMFLLGECFVKVSNYDDDVYGKVYRARKLYETQKNSAGDYAALAAASLAEKKYGEDTQAKQWYDKGMLPPARIHLRSARYAVKMFLSHYHEVEYFLKYGTVAPLPYAISHLGHAHYMPVPHWEMIPGLEVARRNTIPVSVKYGVPSGANFGVVDG